DSEVYTAVLPSLVTTNGMLVGISSPYRRHGLMHSKHRQFFGSDSDDTLVVQGPTLTFNKTLDPAAIAAQQQADPTAARSEWNAEFRSDISSFLDDELIDIAVDRARPLELPPRPGVFYKAYVDASGGAVGGDAYTIAISHREHGCYIIDALRGRAGPFDPEELTKEYAALCKQYRCAGVTGDKYGREWVASAWRKCSIPYTTATLTASDTYLEALPLWTRGQVRIPDHPILLRELRLLERMPTRMGKDQVVHPRGCHDDFSNVTFGALYNLANHLGAYADALAKATQWDDEETTAARFFREQAERRHAELRPRYGRPPPPAPLPDEWVKQVKAAELPQHITEALTRARVEAALRRNGGQT